MHASAPFRMTASHFSVWRGALATLAGSAMAVQMVWLLSVPLDWLAFAAVIGLFTLITLVFLVCHLWRLQPLSMRWDSQCWHIGAAAAPGREARSGRMSVAMDLGAWMLLIFQADGPSSARRLTWLPIQRRGHEADWHGLRCAVYGSSLPPESAPTSGATFGGDL